jgi:hypothetical protein
MQAAETGDLVSLDRFYALRGLAAGDVLYVRLRRPTYIDVLVNGAAYCGRLDGGATIRGLEDAPPPAVVAGLLGAADATGVVAQTPGGAADGPSAVLSVQAEDDGLVIALSVPVAETSCGPVMQDAFLSLFAAVTAWQAVAITLAEQDVEAAGGYDEDDEDQAEDDDVSGEIDAVGASGLGRRVQRQCEELLRAHAPAMREALSADVPRLGSYAFALAQQPSTRRASLVADARRRREEALRQAERAHAFAERKRKREEAESASTAAGRRGGRPDGGPMRQARFAKPTVFANSDSDSDGPAAAAGPGPRQLPQNATACAPTPGDWAATARLAPSGVCRTGATAVVGRPVGGPGAAGPPAVHPAPCPVSSAVEAPGSHSRPVNDEEAKAKAAKKKRRRRFVV